MKRLLAFLTFLFPSIASAGGGYVYQPVNNAVISPSSITISGITSGSVWFSTTSGNLWQNNSGLFFDNQNARLGLGTASPAQKLHLSSGTVLIDGNTGTSIQAIGVAIFGSATAAAVDGTLIVQSTSTTPTNPVIKIMAQNGTTELARITQAGRLGVNITAPGDDIHTSGGIKWGGATSLANLTSDGGDPVIQMVGTKNLRFYNVGEVARISNAGRLGIGNAAPATLLHMSSGTVTVDGNTAVSERLIGHSEWNGTSPSIASCGTGATITGSDVAGHVVIGTGGSTVCALTFANAFTNRPHCVAQDETSATLIKPVNATTSLTLTATLTAGDTVQYWCPSN